MLKKGWEPPALGRERFDARLHRTCSSSEGPYCLIRPTTVAFARSGSDQLAFETASTKNSMQPRCRSHISLATGSDVAIITACPFDMSTTKQQAAIKKFRASPVYRLVIEPDEQAQQLGLLRAKLLVAAMSMERTGLPAREGNPMKDEFPCNYCDFKTLCISDGPEFGLMFPPIPQSWLTPQTLGRSRSVKALSELRILLPIGRYDCHECPGAFYLRWPRIIRKHNFKHVGDKPQTVTGFLGFEETAYPYRCRTCGTEQLVGSMAHSSRLFMDGLMEQYLAINGPMLADDTVKLAWVDDDRWSI